MRSFSSTNLAALRAVSHGPIFSDLLDQLGLIKMPMAFLLLFIDLLSLPFVEAFSSVVATEYAVIYIASHNLIF